MNNLNSVLVEGNLTRDPELTYSPQGTARTRLGLACHRYYRKDDEYQEETSFFDVTVWGRQAEVCEEYLKKGRSVRVVGRLQQDRWQDEQGNPHSRVQIIAQHVEFGPRRDGAADDKQEGADTQEKEKEEAAVAV